MPVFSHIRFVLVGTTHPGNIGAVARAMKTQCLSDLALVTPKTFPSPEADARASGAVDVLAQAAVFDDVAAAVADCALVVGTSARGRELAVPAAEPREIAAEIAALPAGARAAILLGPERSGLTNEHLGFCNALVHIPANPVYSSLNLGAAAQILAYELHLALRLNEPSATPDEPLASNADIQRLLAHLQQTMLDTGFLDAENPKRLMPRVQRLFSRLRLEQTEVNILRGFLAQIDKRRR